MAHQTVSMFCFVPSCCAQLHCKQLQCPIVAQAALTEMQDGSGQGGPGDTAHDSRCGIAWTALTAAVLHFGQRT